MKKLIIVRHCKSNWDYVGIKDIDRPLKPERISDAYKMAKKLNQLGVEVQKILSSSANRALHTATIFAREMQISASIINICDHLYLTGSNSILNEIYSTNDAISCLMIFGHNPTFTNFANEYLINKIDNIPTSGVVILTFDCDEWNQISKNNLSDEFFDYPKNNS